jgi:hypothetical protein
VSLYPLEVGDVFKAHGRQWRKANDSHISLEQFKVMSAIERCRTSELGGHTLECLDCHHTQIAYNSCRNRHCPKCQGSLAKRWLSARESELLPVPYFHVVFTIPAELRGIAYQNKALVYGFLFQAVSETLLTIARDKRYLDAQIGAILVLHTWGSSLVHHPHIHCIVPGGGLSADKQRWTPCKKKYFLPNRVLSSLFRRLLIEKLAAAFDQGLLTLCGSLESISTRPGFMKHVIPLKKRSWIVYAKAPFAGPKQVLSYLSRYTHRVAIANSRLLSMDDTHVQFKWKDYRDSGKAKQKVMSLSHSEFMRRFLLHALPKGFQRIRHIGILGNPVRRKNIETIRALAHDAKDNDEKLDEADVQQITTEEPADNYPCPCCQGPMILVEHFTKTQEPRAPPKPRLFHHE